jgi:acyl carrier protein
MTTDEIRTTIVRLLCDVAPEADPAEIQPDVEFRDQLDIDSMDLLNFVVAVDQELGVEIPEREYRRLGTVDALTAYVAEQKGLVAAQ